MEDFNRLLRFLHPFGIRLDLLLQMSLTMVVFRTDDQTMRTSSRTASDYLSADDASLKTASRKPSIRSSSSARRLSADDESLVPTLSSYYSFQ